MDMMSQVYGGVDTHLDTHTATVVTPIGQVLGTRQFPATGDGYTALSDWAASFGTVAAFGVEGTGSYGSGLARHLTTSGYDVRELTRPNRQHRRRYGKSDPADAVAAARAVAAGTATGTPRCLDGPVEAARNLKVARDAAVKARTQIVNQIRALIVTAPEPLRRRLHGQPIRGVAVTVTETLATYPEPDLTRPEVAALTALAALTGIWATLGNHVRQLTNQLSVPVTAAAPPAFLDQPGVGIVVAADLLICAGENPHRFRSEAAFAAACGVSPVDASSGRQQRHRLNRGGDRDANAALYRIVIVRLRYHQPTRDYMTSHLAQGKTKREIIRNLKRYIARDIHHILTRPH